MANACKDCGGVGYGYLDPEVGHRGTEPCATCSAKLEERAEDGEFDTKLRGKTVKGKAPELGRPVKLAPVKKKTVDFVDAAPRSGAEDEEGMTVEDLVDKGVFSQAEVDAQNEKDLEAMGAESPEAGEE